MKTQLLALNAELELLNEAYSTIYDSQISKLDQIINKWIVEPNNATCVRRWYKIGFEPNELDINIEVGFYDKETDKIDFGSDFFIGFNSGEEKLSVNHGTIGRFDKTDIYQVKRLSTLTHIFNNVESIETALKEFASEAYVTASAHDKQRYELQHQIHSVESLIKKNKQAEIDAKLVVGNTLEYSETTTIRPAFQLFKGPAAIIKRTPKFITCNDSNNIVRRMPVAEIITSIYNTNMIVKESI